MRISIPVLKSILTSIPEHPWNQVGLCPLIVNCLCKCTQREYIHKQKSNALINQSLQMILITVQIWLIWDNSKILVLIFEKLERVSGVILSVTQMVNGLSQLKRSRKRRAASPSAAGSAALMYTGRSKQHQRTSSCPWAAVTACPPVCTVILCQLSLPTALHEQHWVTDWLMAPATYCFMDDSKGLGIAMTTQRLHYAWPRSRGIICSFKHYYSFMQHKKPISVDFLCVKYL